MSAQEMSCVIFRPRLRATLQYLALGIACLVAGIWFSQIGRPIGILIAIMGALATIAFSVQLIPGNSYLRVDEHGITHCGFFRANTTPWSKIASIYVVYPVIKGMGPQKLIGIKYVPAPGPLNLPQHLVFNMARCDGMLPDIYDRSAESLVTFLNQCLEQFHLRNDQAE